MVVLTGIGVARKYNLGSHLTYEYDMQRGLEQGSPEWTLMEEKQKRLIWEFGSINIELDSIQVEEDMRELRRLGWKLAETKTIDGAVFETYAPPESFELIN